MGFMTMILWPLVLICLNYIPVCKNFTGKLIPHYMWPFSYNVNDVIEQQHAIFVSKMGLRERLTHTYHIDIFRCLQSLYMNVLNRRNTFFQLCIHHSITSLNSYCSLQWILMT
jgi:hypothetical protein